MFLCNLDSVKCRMEFSFDLKLVMSLGCLWQSLAVLNIHVFCMCAQYF